MITLKTLVDNKDVVIDKFIEVVLFDATFDHDSKDVEWGDGEEKKINDFVSKVLTKIVSKFGEDYTVVFYNNPLVEVTQFGSDLYMTLVGHGVGLWEPEWCKNTNKISDYLIDNFREFYFETGCIGDDGKLYTVL